jgi:hypothetical protein
MGIVRIPEIQNHIPYLLHLFFCHPGIYSHHLAQQALPQGEGQLFFHIRWDPEGIQTLHLQLQNLRLEAPGNY